MSKFKEILFLTDLSPLNFDILLYAGYLAVKFGSSKLTILNSYHTGNLSLVNNPYDDDDSKKAIGVKALKTYYRVLNTVFSQLDGNCEIELVCENGVFISLAEYYSERFDLVIMGSQGQGYVRNRLFGTNAKKLMEKIKTPLLIIPARKGYSPPKNHVVNTPFFVKQNIFDDEAFTFPCDKILYAVDIPTTSSLKDQQFGLQSTVLFAQCLDSSVDFLNVDIAKAPKENDVVQRTLVESKDYKNLPEKLQEKFGFKKLIESVIQYKKSEYVLVVGRGQPHQHITRYIRDEKVSVVAMFKPKYSVLTNFFHKSVTKQVIDHLEVPLLLFHKPQ